MFLNADEDMNIQQKYNADKNMKIQQVTVAEGVVYTHRKKVVIKKAVINLFPKKIGATDVPKIILEKLYPR